MERKVKKRCYNDLEDATATEIVSLSSGDSGLWIGEEEWECEGSPVGNANGRRWECEWSPVGMWRICWNAKCRRRGVGDEELASWRGEVRRREGRRTVDGGNVKDRRIESSSVATDSSAVEGTMTMTMASSGDGDKRRAQATATWDVSASSGNGDMRCISELRRRRAGFGGESEGKRENQVSEEKNGKWNKKKRGWIWFLA